MTTSNPSPPGSAVFARIFWMMLGPLFLLMLAFGIVSKGSGWFTVPDFAFLAVLAGTIVARWVDFRGGSPQTATGEPATSAHLRRYALGAALIGLGVWVGANLLGNYWLAR